MDTLQTLPRTLPASWFCSSALYQLERRAVFLKCWHFLGPVTRFQKRGKEGRVSYEIAQVNIYVENQSPELDRISSDGISVFDEQSKLMRSHLTPSGLLFTALSDEAPSFEEYFTGLEPLTNSVDFTLLPHRRTISYHGNFNWKTMVDGYQECLHCEYTHPTFSQFYPPKFYSVRCFANFAQHIADPARPADGLFLYFFPICTLNVYGGGMSSFRVCPTPNPGITRMEFDYYHSGTEDEFERYYAFVRQVAQEDFELCEKAQGNLERGVYGEGCLNPARENGVAFYQGRVREAVWRQVGVEKEEVRKMGVEREREMEMERKKERAMEHAAPLSADVGAGAESMIAKEVAVQ